MKIAPFQTNPLCPGCGVLDRPGKPQIAQTRSHNHRQMTLWQRFMTWLRKPICRGLTTPHVHHTCLHCGHEWLTETYERSQSDAVLKNVPMAKPPETEPSSVPSYCGLCGGTGAVADGAGGVVICPCSGTDVGGTVVEMGRSEGKTDRVGGAGVKKDSRRNPLQLPPSPTMEEGLVGYSPSGLVPLPSTPPRPRYPMLPYPPTPEPRTNEVVK
jgi:hypothetical protein